MAAAIAAAPAQGASGPVIFTVAGGDRGGFAGDGGPATKSLLNGPAGLLAVPNGFILSDTINQRIRGTDFNGRITTGLGTGRAGDSGDGGTGIGAELQDPTAIAPTDNGLLFADTANSKIRGTYCCDASAPRGTLRTYAGTGVSGYSGDGGPAVQAQLNEPTGLLVLDGVIYIADTGNNRVRAIDKDGTIRTIAGTGAAGFGGDGGAAGLAMLNRPAGLASDYPRGILVADSGNNRIRRIGFDGSIATVAGNGAASSGGDGGPATAAALNSPMDVAVSDGIYIAETGGNRIRRVDATGTISRFAGAGGPRYGGDGGPPQKALLNAPRAVEVFNGTGGPDLLIADSDNNRIRYVALPRPADTDAQEFQGPLLALAARPAAVLAPLKKVAKSLVVKDVKLGYVLSTGAPVTFVVRKKKTTRTILKFTRPGGPGLNRTSLPVRLRAGKKRLTKGFYTVTLTAKDKLGRVAVKQIALTVR